MKTKGTTETKQTEPVNLEVEEGEEYVLNYIMRDNVINITVNDGGVVIFQTGKPKDNPPVPPNP